MLLTLEQTASNAQSFIWPTLSPKLRSKRRFAYCCAIAAVMVLVSSCADLAGPEYQRPEVVQKDRWSDSQQLKISAAETIRPDWWRNFDDPYLDQLMGQALANNLDLAVLAARTGVAEAAIGQANASRLPTIDAALGANFQKFEGTSIDHTVSQAVALGWEVDIWGKLKKGVEAQASELKATEADWRAGYLSLAANVSQTYFQIRKLDEQIDRQQTALNNNRQIQSIFESQLREGIIPKTQVLQQQAEVGRLENDLLELQRLRQLSENALATLLGIAAGDLKVPAQHLSDTVNVITVPGGLPAQLLSRRPDIVAAEYRVLQAHNLEGQARLAKLPSINLTANTGATSTEFSQLLKDLTFGLTPTMSLPIFDPNVRSRLKVSEAQTKVAEAEYRRTVIRAFEEVENALVNVASRHQQHDQFLQRRDKLRIVTDQIRAQLREGMVTQLQVFEAERSLLAAELSVLENHQRYLSDTVALYKALGGGWASDAR